MPKQRRFLFLTTTESLLTRGPSGLLPTHPNLPNIITNALGPDIFLFSFGVLEDPFFDPFFEGQNVAPGKKIGNVLGTVLP